MPRSNVKFGQNFLVDEYVIEKIINNISEKNCRYVEIGPGHGALTIPFARKEKEFTAIEIDNKLVNILTNNPSLKDISFINKDVMLFDFNDICLDHGSKKLFIFGNLPYQISSLLMLKLRLYKDSISKMLFMVQKEVADRISATPGTPEYGRLSVMVQAWCKAEQLFDVGPESFNPAPKVNSAVFIAYPDLRPLTISMDWYFFEKIIAKSFRHKRKMLYSSFKKVLTEVEWQDLGFSLLCRPADLTVDEYICLTLKLQEQDMDYILMTLKA